MQTCRWGPLGLGGLCTSLGCSVSPDPWCPSERRKRQGHGGNMGMLLEQGWKLGVPLSALARRGGVQKGAPFPTGS